MKSKLLQKLQLFGNGTFWIAVLCALVYSVSGWFVKWAGYSFTSDGQLVIRAILSIFVSLIWFAALSIVDRIKSKDKTTKEKVATFELGSYNKKILFLVFLCRPLFNLFFILSISLSDGHTATISLMILLFIKMLTNVVIDCIKEKKAPTLIEIISYSFVTVGIVVYGLRTSDVWSYSLIFAVGSGFLEAVRLSLIDKLKVDPRHKPKFSIFEFFAMLAVTLVIFAVGYFAKGEGMMVTGVTSIDPKSLFALGILPIQAVIILAIDYYVTEKKMPTGIYSAILATEMGFAGLINHLTINDPFEGPQIAGLLIAMASIIVLKVASNKDEQKKNKKIETSVDVSE